MPYQVLARKYRPLRFADVIGQDHVTRTLLNALAQGRIAHGYIFSGHRGIGKTTVARILASALNCRNVIGSDLRPTPEPCNQCESCLEIRQGNAVDVIEIDAATNRGIDEIRELRDAARYQPSRDKYKIYILDEAHQITDAAFNALLKTLEEPPEHIVFMMATTQPEDIPQTIRSRCQHYSFHAVRLDDLLAQLRAVAASEGISADDAALSLLAEAGDGSVRDALSIMDQAIASAPMVGGPDGAASQPHLEAEQLRSLMGAVSNAVFEDILDAVYRNHSADVLEIVNRLLDAGNGPQPLARQLVRYLRNCTVAKITGLAAAPAASSDTAESTGLARELLQISEAERQRAARSASLFSEEDLARFLAVMLRTFDELGFRQEPRLHLEVGLLKLVHLQRLLPVEELLTQLGAAPAPPPPTPRSTASPAPGPAASPTPGTAAGAATAPKAASASAPLSRPAPAAGAAPVRTAPLTANPTSKPVPSPARDPVPNPAPNPAPSPASPAPAAPVRAASAPAPVPVAQTETPASSPVSAPQHVQLPPPAAVTTSAPVTPISPNPTAAAPVPVLSTSASAGSAAPAPAAPATGEEPSAANHHDSASTDLQAAMVAKLAGTKSQQTAADALHDATCSVTGATLQIRTSLSKTMLPVVFNAETERLLREVLRSTPGAPASLEFLPGAAPEPTVRRKTRPAAAGSAAELAEKHPVVQQARELFSAEISNVIDLRES